MLSWILENTPQKVESYDKIRFLLVIIVLHHSFIHSSQQSSDVKACRSCFGPGRISLKTPWWIITIAMLPALWKMKHEWNTGCKLCCCGGVGSGRGVWPCNCHPKTLWSCNCQEFASLGCLSLCGRYQQSELLYLGCCSFPEHFQIIRNQKKVPPTWAI